MRFGFFGNLTFCKEVTNGLCFFFLRCWFRLFDEYDFSYGFISMASFNHIRGLSNGRI